MDRGLLFYFLLGIVAVGAGGLSDRALKHRMGHGARYAVSLLVTALACVILVLIARPLGL